MKHYASAAMAVLLPIFAASGAAKAQQAFPFPFPFPGMSMQSAENCGTLKEQHQKLEENLGEKLLAMGLFSNGKEVFMLYGDKDAKTFTVMHAEPDASSACVKLSGEQLKVESLDARAPGFPVSFSNEDQKPVNLSDFEYLHAWKYQESLQISGVLPKGQVPSEQGDVQFRLYANTQNGKFSVVMIGDNGEPDIVASGDHFVSPELIGEKTKVAAPAPAPIAQ